MSIPRVQLVRLAGVDDCVKASSRHMMTRSVREINVKVSVQGIVDFGNTVLGIAVNVATSGTSVQGALTPLFGAITHQVILETDR